MSFWRNILPLRWRSRRSLESTFFVTTFIAALVTVSLSASTILPCPANGKGTFQDRLDSRGPFSEEEVMSDDAKKTHTRYAPESLPVGGLGQRAYLTRRGGWIEIEERPPLFSWRRWTS